jgi:hypothetical protein
VEEYVCASRPDPQGTALDWALFFEKDWPVDAIEFRPQVSSVGRMTTAPEDSFAFAVWSDGRWRTRVVPAAHGPSAGGLELADCYLWGTWDIGDVGRRVLVTSPVGPGDRDGYRIAATVELRDAESGEVLHSLEGARPVCSPALPLPPGVGFYAAHEDLAIVEHAGRRRLLVVLLDGAAPLPALWNPSDGRPPLRLGARGLGLVHAVDPLLVSDDDGRLSWLTANGDWGSIGPVAGRLLEPLAWDRDDPELVVRHADDRIVGLQPQEGGFACRWEASGGPTALAHRDGAPALLAVTPDGTTVEHRVLRDGRWEVVDRHLVGSGRITGVVAAPDMSAVALTVSDSRHTGRTLLLDDRLRVVASRGFAAAPGPMALGSTSDGTDVAVLDDHGIMHVMTRDGTQIAERDWTAAYTTPVILPAGDSIDILRATGIHGTERVSIDGDLRWRTLFPLWSVFPGATAVGEVAGRGWLAVAPGRDGVIRVQDVETGRVDELPDLGPFVPSRTIAAADLDDDGSDEFVLGRRDGTLVCLGARDAGWEVRWEVALGSPLHAVIVAAMGEPGRADLVVSTIDGSVRLLRFEEA